MTDPAGPPESKYAVDFDAVFESQFGYVWKTLRRLGVSERELPDITQDVFMTVLALLADYDPSRPLRPWLFGISYRIALRHRALVRHFRESYGEAVETSDPSPLADESVAQAQDRALVLAAIGRIDLHRRAVFIMSELDEEPMPRIADALGIPLNTAYSRLRLARAEFRDAIRELRGEPSGS